MARIVYPCTILVNGESAGFRLGAQVHDAYPPRMADTMRQVRNLILQIGDLRPDEFRFQASGKLNERAFGIHVGVSPSTIHRIIRGQRNLTDDLDRSGHRMPGDWAPSPRLLDGLGALLGVTSRRQVWAAIERAREPAADDPSAAQWGKRPGSRRNRRKR